MRKQGIDGTGMLNLYDRVTGIFNDIFDARLLTAALFALEGYCVLFTQRKFPMRWMVFVLFGMILLAFVTLTARTPGRRARVRFHRGMAGLWFALHGMMVVSGLFYQDWLPESVPLLICYPIVFSVFASRDDESTFRSILRGAVFAVLPFLVGSYLTVPVTWGYPGYKGVFYDANCMSMCCIVMATSAFLLAYASFTQRHRKAALAYLLLGILAAGTLLLTLSRSGLLAFVGVAVILTGALIAGTARHPRRLLALLAVFIALAGFAGYQITMQKVYEAAVEDYELALYNNEVYGNPITVPKPEDKHISMDDLTSDRWGIWMTILENLTWNGHESSVVQEWVAKDGAGERLYNAHNAFFGVTYNNGWIAGILLCAYTALAFVRSVRYYWMHRKSSPYAATPLAFCTVFILVGLFESVYAPFSVIGCTYLLVQAPLWRADLSRRTAEDL
ncbi:MAG TPA: O-antigen ligase family protein [Candidatus Ventricola intestinavium]|nr:O-antigen ligase family protein [Candidatus Ventricola intestinavium]